MKSLVLKMTSSSLNWEYTRNQSHENSEEIKLKFNLRAVMGALPLKLPIFASEQESKMLCSTNHSKGEKSQTDSTVAFPPRKQSKNVVAIYQQYNKTGLLTRKVSLSFFLRIVNE